MNVTEKPSDVSAWIAYYQSSPEAPRKPLVDPADYAKLIEGVTDSRDKAMLRVLMDSGIRATELVDLNRDSIRTEVVEKSDGSIATVAIGSVPDAKSGGNREFILSPMTMDAIGHYLTTERAEDNDPVLFIPRSPRRTSRLSAVMIRKLLAESCDKVGIERFGLHEFRRSLVARFHRLGLEPLFIQHALGYAKAESMIRVLPPRSARNTE